MAYLEKEEAKSGSNGNQKRSYGKQFGNQKVGGSYNAKADVRVQKTHTQGTGGFSNTKVKTE